MISFDAIKKQQEPMRVWLLYQQDLYPFSFSSFIDFTIVKPSDIISTETSL
jgi:hypothetical protein